MIRAFSNSFRSSINHADVSTPSTIQTRKVLKQASIVITLPDMGDARNSETRCKDIENIQCMYSSFCKEYHRWCYPYNYCHFHSSLSAGRSLPEVFYKISNRLSSDVCIMIECLVIDSGLIPWSSALRDFPEMRMLRSLAAKPARCQLWPLSRSEVVPLLRHGIVWKRKMKNFPLKIFRAYSMFYIGNVHGVLSIPLMYCFHSKTPNLRKDLLRQAS